MEKVRPWVTVVTESFRVVKEKGGALNSGTTTRSTMTPKLIATSISFCGYKKNVGMAPLLRGVVRGFLLLPQLRFLERHSLLVAVNSDLPVLNAIMQARFSMETTVVFLLRFLTLH